MFSELVDEIVAETRRGVDKAQITAFLNSTLRECQTFKGALFDRDLVEDTVTTTAANPFIWTRALRFRKIRAAQYAETGIYPKFIAPGKKIRDETDYFYAATTYLAFFGAGDTKDINLAYFTYLRRLLYYDVADRPAVFDIETETWAYHATYDVSDEQRTLAESLVSNWLTFDWHDLVKEGAVNKTLKRAKDDKANMSFAAYKSMQNDLLNGELIINLEAAQNG